MSTGWMLGAALVTSVVVACGGGTSKSLSSDVAASRVHVPQLTADDLGSGWTAAGSTPTSAPAHDLDSCLHLPPQSENIASSPIAAYEHGVSGGTEQLQVFTVAVKNSASLDPLYRALSGPGFADCVKPRLQAQASSSATGAAALSIGSVSADIPFSGVRRSARLNVPFSLTLGAQTFAGGLDIGMVRTGQLLSVIAVTEINTKVPDSDWASWLAKVAARQLVAAKP